MEGEYPEVSFDISAYPPIVYANSTHHWESDVITKMTNEKTRATLNTGIPNRPTIPSQDRLTQHSIINFQPYRPLDT